MSINALSETHDDCISVRECTLTLTQLQFHGLLRENKTIKFIKRPSTSTSQEDKRSKYIYKYVKSKYDVSYSPSDGEFFSFARDSSKIVGPLFRSCQEEIRKFTIRPLIIPQQTFFFFLVLLSSLPETKRKTNTREARGACTREKRALNKSMCHS